MINTLKITLKDVIGGVYTAKQCTDLNDCDNALKQLETAQRLYPHYYKSIRKRADAIIKKKSKLSQ